MAQKPIYPMKNGTITRCDCGHDSEPSYFFASGYGKEGKTGKTICYQCCADRKKESLIKEGKGALYISKKENGYYELTDWAGKLRIDVVCLKDGFHNIAGTRKDVWFKLVGDIESTEPHYAYNEENVRVKVKNKLYVWHGVCYGEMTQVCHIKRTKRVEF